VNTAHKTESKRTMVGKVKALLADLVPKNISEPSWL
jgi:hypothetical protein